MGRQAVRPLRVFRDIAKVNWNELNLVDGCQGHPALSKVSSVVQLGEARYLTKYQIGCDWAGGSDGV